MVSKYNLSPYYIIVVLTISMIILLKMQISSSTLDLLQYYRQDPATCALTSSPDDSDGTLKFENHCCKIIIPVHRKFDLNPTILTLTITRQLCNKYSNLYKIQKCSPSPDITLYNTECKLSESQRFHYSYVFS